MKYIAHRINTVEELRRLPKEYGVEIDLRDSLDGSVYIQHNPFEAGEDFEEYLKEYAHGTMILNIKSERIEHRVLELVRKYNVKDYFFLDSSFPMIYLLSNMGEKKIALRFSEYEGMDTVRAMAGKIDWIWVDTFTRLPVTKDIFAEMKELGYKLCMVSPELQGQPEKIESYKEQIKREGMAFDAVCSKACCMGKWKGEEC